MPQVPALSPGTPASWNLRVATDLRSPTCEDVPSHEATLFIEPRISGDENLRLPVHHLLYFFGPCSRRTICSIQSVAGHPVAAPDSIPAHHGLAPAALNFAATASISDQVFGIVTPSFLNCAGEYQTSDFDDAPNGAP